jgi:hypothetical protein
MFTRIVQRHVSAVACAVYYACQGTVGLNVKTVYFSQADFSDTFLSVVNFYEFTAGLLRT